MMCPACIANAAVMAASVTSGGGFVAIVAARFRNIVNSHKPSSKGKAKEKQP